MNISLSLCLHILSYNSINYNLKTILRSIILNIYPKYSEQITKVTTWHLNVIIFVLAVSNCEHALIVYPCNTWDHHSVCLSTINVRLQWPGLLQTRANKLNEQAAVFDRKRKQLSRFGWPSCTTAKTGLSKVTTWQVHESKMHKVLQLLHNIWIYSFHKLIECVLSILRLTFS